MEADLKTSDERNFILNHKIDKISKQMNIPLFIHVVLTERCPFNCNQCYSSLSNVEMEWDAFSKRIQEASSLKISSILLTGGEPLVYSRFLDAVHLLSTYKMECRIATSGYGLDEDIARKLYYANVSRVFVSLNGSTAEINDCSRAGFYEAINALNTLRSAGISCGINWVARSDNIEDFERMINLAKDYDVDEFVILKNKPDRSGLLESALSEVQINFLSQAVVCCKTATTGLIISIDPCFSELREKLINKRYFPASCCAGKTFFDILPNNTLVPCRHFNNSSHNILNTNNLTIEEYWKTLVTEIVKHKALKKYYLEKGCAYNV